MDNIYEFSFFCLNYSANRIEETEEKQGEYTKKKKIVLIFSWRQEMFVVSRLGGANYSITNFPNTLFKSLSLPYNFFSKILNYAMFSILIFSYIDRKKNVKERIGIFVPYFIMVMGIKNEK